ncbi:hypothetical protein [Kitasatospora sp. NPDC056531]|uniref:hypothetical protein n=1 Tax=Kitasatospora sp. NPDC056531 TaxID=3345856 RepID=UPI0036C1DBD4
MKARTLLTFGAAAAGLVSLFVTAPSATAAPAAKTGTDVVVMTSQAAAAKCSTWFDNNGPGGAGRAHAKCPGVYVQITITCADGQRNTSAWRYGYAKAECSYGVDWESAVYATK